ncbi:MAG: hypothetical protein K8S23_11930, partial [Candidatus Cloacimonetes bacterium]|nr:hypothetical protein [Candidatus Cloacimonadota bacterium]
IIFDENVTWSPIIYAIKELKRRFYETFIFFVNKCLNFLFLGKIDEIKDILSAKLKKKKREKLLKKWRDYFKKNQNKMQYKTFKEMEFQSEVE